MSMKVIVKPFLMRTRRSASLPKTPQFLRIVKTWEGRALSRPRFCNCLICIKMIHTLPTEYKDDYQDTGRRKHDGQKVFQSAYKFIIPHPPSPYMTVKQESQRRES